MWNNMKQTIKRLKWIFIGEIILSLLLIGWSGISMMHDWEIVLTSDDLFLVGGGGITEEGEYYIDESIGERGVFTCGPYRKLDRGIYKVTVFYRTDSSDHVCYAFSETAEYLYQGIRSDRAEMKAQQNSKLFHVWVGYSLEDFEIRTEYSGSGSLAISQISLIRSKQTYSILLMGWFAFVMLVDACVILCYGYRNRRISSEQISVGAGLGLIIVFASYPLFYDFLLQGTDLQFHLMRIEGLKDALKAGMFPVKMYPSWINGYGYPISIFYGDIFLYFPAILRILGLPLQNAYQFYCAVVNMATSLVAYGTMKKIFKDSRIALFGSALYTLSVFRMMMMYTRPMVGLPTGMVFLPLIVYGAYRILTEETIKNRYRTAWLPVAIGLSGVIQSHILTCVMLVLLMPILLFLMFRQIVQKPRIIMLCKAAIMTVGLNLWFLWPFLEGMGWKINIANSARKDVMYNIQANGIYVSNLFSIFPKEPNIPYQTDYSVGAALIVGIILYVYLIGIRRYKCHRTIAQLGVVTMTLGLLTTFMATKIFPWDLLAAMLGDASTLIRNIQFPWRFLGFASVLLSFGTCVTVYCLKENKFLLCHVMLGLCLLNVLTTGWVMSQHIDTAEILRVYDTEGMDGYDYVTGWGTQEYLLQGTDSSQLRFGAYEESASVDIIHAEKKGGNISVQCQNGRRQSGYIEVPLLFYPGYQAVWEETGEKLTITDNDNHVMRVLLPEGFAGTVRIAYTGLWYWKIAYLISAIFFIGTIVYYARSLQTSKTQNE